MYFYNKSDKDNPKDNDLSAHLFGQSFDEFSNMNDFNNNNNNNPFLNFESHSLPSQSFDSGLYNNSPSPNQPQQELLFSSFDLNNGGDLYNISQNDFTLSDDLNPSLFLEANNTQDLDQQAILLSDPNFLRQQQLLQDQQQKVNDPTHSNLSAMFQNTEREKSPLIKPINLISSQQQRKDILNNSGHLNKTMTGKITKPIPISSSSNTNTNPISSSMPSGIDHQRRFNELQARFRISYPKKQKNQTHALGSSMPNNLNERGNPYLSSSLNDPKLEPTKPILRVNHKESAAKPKQELTHATTNAIPIQSANPNQSAMNPTPSSFPSRTMPIQIHRVQRATGLQNFDLEQRQKKLDDQLVKADFDDITVSELKELLRQRGKPATGKKAVLLQRLQEERDMIQHARANGIPILSRYAPQQSPMMGASPVIDTPSSFPDYLSSSPSQHGIGSLNRSIADMHIGSPPPNVLSSSQQSRRFAPYGTSPRTSNLVPNMQHPNIYSASVPTSTLDMMMMQQQQQQQQQEPTRLVRGFHFNKKSYAPFMSSTLATPDRDDDQNPFDNLKQDIDVKEEKVELTPNDMDWSDPTLDFMLQQGFNSSELQNKSADELLSLLESLDNSHPNSHMDHSQLIPDLSSVMYDYDQQYH